MNRKKVLIPLAAAAAALGFVLTVGAVNASAGHHRSGQPEAAAPVGAPAADDEPVPGKSGTTADGRTFGPMPTTAAKDDRPDLVLVIGDSGVLGYADSSLLDFGMASSPEEAVELSKAAPKPVKAPVYDESGQKIIDYFTFGGDGGEGGDDE